MAKQPPTQAKRRLTRAQLAANREAIRIEDEKWNRIGAELRASEADLAGRVARVQAIMQRVRA